MIFLSCLIIISILHHYLYYAVICASQGVLCNGLDVAIKSLLISDDFPERRVHHELNIVAKLQHKNIVKLLGYGYPVIQTGAWAEDRKDQAEGRLYFSVEEHMPNGNLEENLEGMFSFF